MKTTHYELRNAATGNRYAPNPTDYENEYTPADAVRHAQRLNLSSYAIVQVETAETVISVVDAPKVSVVHEDNAA